MTTHVTADMAASCSRKLTSGPGCWKSDRFQSRGRQRRDANIGCVFGIRASVCGGSLTGVWRAGVLGGGWGWGVNIVVTQRKMSASPRPCSSWVMILKETRSECGFIVIILLKLLKNSPVVLLLSGYHALWPYLNNRIRIKWMGYCVDLAYYDGYMWIKRPPISARCLL